MRSNAQRHGLRRSVAQPLLMPGTPTHAKSGKSAWVRLGLMLLAESNIVTVLLPSLLGAAAALVFVAWRRKRAKTQGSLADTHAVARFDERALEDVERSFEQLVADGTLKVERASAEDRAKARIPAHAGAVFRTLAGQYRVIELGQVGVAFFLHEGSIADDDIGGWRLRVEPFEIDVRLAPQGGAHVDAIDNASGDVILDTTWSPKATHEVVRHSTLLHFLVRSALGDKA